MRSFLVPETAGRHGSKWKGRRERYGSATIVAEEAGPELALLLTRRPNTRFESSPTGLRRSGHGPTRPNERLRVLNGAQSSENAGCGTHAGFSTPPLCPCVTRARACISQVRCPVRCGGGWRKYDVALWGEGGNAGGTNGRGQDGGHQGGLVVVVVAYGLCSCRLRHRRARSFLEGSGVSNPTAGQRPKNLLEPLLEDCDVPVEVGQTWKGFRGRNPVLDLERGLETTVITKSDFRNDKRFNVSKEVSRFLKHGSQLQI